MSQITGSNVVGRPKADASRSASAQSANLQDTDLGDGYVPIIDISPYFTGSERDKREVAAQIGRACREVGFYIIVGHGVPTKMVDALDKAARDFFDLPLDEKTKLAGTDAGAVGYAGMGARSLAHTRGEKTPPDLHESFQVSKVDADFASPYFQTPAAKKLVPQNQWPASQPQFKAACTEYYVKMGALARDLMRLSALALDLPETYFDGKIDRHIGRLSFKLYPEQREKPLPGQLRAGAHTDYGTVTILRPGSSVGGLQVADRQGDWHDVPTVPNSFVINQGDMMARWTNDHWLSTLHRVVNPPEEAGGGNRRLSIVFFHHANYDTVVECLPTCTGPDDAPKYQPVTVAEYYALKREQHKGTKS
jgi:isopenicillin N synthase-like dioxygenase